MIELRFFAAIFEILRLEADRGEGEQARALTDSGAAPDNDMRAERDPWPEHDILAYDAVGPDDRVLG